MKWITGVLAFIAVMTLIGPAAVDVSRGEEEISSYSSSDEEIIAYSYGAMGGEYYFRNTDVTVTVEGPNNRTLCLAERSTHGRDHATSLYALALIGYQVVNRYPDRFDTVYLYTFAGDISGEAKAIFASSTLYV